MPEQRNKLKFPKIIVLPVGKLLADLRGYFMVVPVDLVANQHPEHLTEAVRLTHMDTKPLQGDSSICPLETALVSVSGEGVPREIVKTNRFMVSGRVCHVTLSKQTVSWLAVGCSM